MTRYYCSGYDWNDAFAYGLGDMFLKELKDTNSIVYIPTSKSRLQKAKEKHIPAFTKHFKNVGIEFDRSILITPNMTKEEAQQAVREASFVMLLGGDPFDQKELCDKLGIIEELKNYKGILMGYSAGAMLMSKYIIITPCSGEYPDFHIEEGLNLDGISIYPHNNTSDSVYPDTLVVEDEKYRKEDLIKVAKEYGEYYLLQDNLREDGLTDVSFIKSVEGHLEFYTENNGKIWIAKEEGVKLLNLSKNKKK